MDKTNQFDLIILGAGPAGMTAGVYAARKQLRTLIISSDVGGQAMWSSKVDNYLGYVYLSGAELVSKFEQHLKTFDIDLKSDKITNISNQHDSFVVSTKKLGNFNSRAVIIATGKSPKMLNVPGEAKYIGKGVMFCATCDGPLFSGTDVAVVGGGNSGLDAVIQLMKICPKVYVIEFLDGMIGDKIVQKQILEADNVEILTNTQVKEVLGDDFVHSISIQNRDTKEIRVLTVKGVFVEIGLIPNTDFANKIVTLNEFGEILIDCGGKTSVPGLFAAGDVTSVPEKQIIIAAGDGAKAALAAYSYLIRLPTSPDWSKI